MNVTNKLQGGIGVDLELWGVYQNPIQLLSISGNLASIIVNFLHNHLIH